MKGFCWRPQIQFSVTGSLRNSQCGQAVQQGHQYGCSAPHRGCTVRQRAVALELHFTPRAGFQAILVPV